MSKPRGRGRPPKRRRDVKSATIVVRMTLEDRADIDRVAADDGVSASEWARRVLLGAVLDMRRLTISLPQPKP